MTESDYNLVQSVDFIMKPSHEIQNQGILVQCATDSVPSNILYYDNDGIYKWLYQPYHYNNIPCFIKNPLNVKTGVNDFCEWKSINDKTSRLPDDYICQIYSCKGTISKCNEIHPMMRN